MLVRVYDEQSGTYFKSEVYAIINPGWYEKMLVIVPTESGDYFKFIEYLDKSEPEAPKVLINLVLPSGFSDEFELLHRRTKGVDEQLEDFSEVLDENTRFVDYAGYAWIYEDKAFLVKLLNGGMVSTKGYESRTIDSDAYKVTGWQYIESQNDVDSLLEQTSSFHDTALKEMGYVSGAYVDEENSMYCTDSVRRVIMRFDSQWCRPIEMIFEGVTALNLRPALDNCSSNIFGASLFLRNATVFFSDNQMYGVDKTYEGTWIESYSLRWRFCD